MTNFAFGVGRQDYSNYGGNQRDFATGQMIGDALAVGVGTVVAYGGATAVGAGTGALAVGTAGAGAVAIPAGAAAASATFAYGASVAATAGFNLSKGSANPEVRDAINYGQEQHRAYNPGENYQLNKPLPGTKLRPDAIDVENGIIRELKPDNIQAIQRGFRQLSGYIKAANKAFGKKFKGVVDTYTRSNK